MKAWPKYPLIYEINTWVWLQELAKKSKVKMDLAAVPDEEWDAIADLGFDAVWLMGVWERSPAGIGVSMQNTGLLEDFKRALPDFKTKDNVGSPYCIRRYVVDRHLGGPGGLAAARTALANRGIRLILDFVPNHVAPDHPWVKEHPEYFITGSLEDATADPSSFLEIGGKVFACGRDPYFPAWPDVLQINVYQPSLRNAVIETISGIADQCDGIRCDMAMLVLNGIFERTWGSRAGTVPKDEYWTRIIPSIRKKNRSFRFIAEAYWDLEWELQQQGFDFCYDKRLYDRLENGGTDSVRLHLHAEITYQNKLLRFIENHDEPRVAAIFPPKKLKAAAVTSLSLPGARLFHEGQLEGRQTRLPVFLGRRPKELPDRDLQKFYQGFLKTLGSPIFKDGEWRLCDISGWPDNGSCENLAAWSWRLKNDYRLVVVNLSDHPSQGLIRLPWNDDFGSLLKLIDVFTDSRIIVLESETSGSGIFVDLPDWGYQILKCSRAE